MKTNKQFSLLVLMILTVTLISCSDSGTDSNESEPPSLPNLAAYSQVNTSYFTSTGSAANPTVANSVNFATAQSLVLGFSSLSMIGQVYTGFLSNAQSSNASFNNGIWEWDYSYNYGGNSASVRLTAEELSTAVDWDVFISLNSAQLNFEDYNVMSGTTQNDGLQGDWTFNAFQEGATGTAVLESEWTAESETDRQLSLEIFDNGTTAASINFNQAGDEYTMAVDFTDESATDTEIYWNTDADIGYIDRDGEDRKCWQGSGQNAADVACSEVGL